MIGSRRHPRGFTIIELLVSITGAMFLSVGVFMIAKHTTGLYQEETRAANANMASIVGFERFRSDLARAGFMSSPNALADTRICAPVPDATWPEFMQQMQSVRIGLTSGLPNLFASNGLTPQEVILSGNFSSAEALPIRTVVDTGTNYVVYLQVASGAMARLGYSVPGANQAQILSDTFPTGRGVRIVDRSGRHHYGIISGTQIAPNPAVILTGPSPRLQFRDTSALGCGITGNETGASINTVNFVRYRIGSLRELPRFAPIFAAPAQGPHDTDRTELIREELNPAGQVIDGTQELIAEYAVDLRFEVTVQTNAASALFHVDNADLYTWAGNPDQRAAGRGPQFIRSIHSWLSVRSRVADRDANINVAAGPRYRIGLGAAGAAPFARLRTIQSRAALHNQ
jgi:hypothetical protein